MSADEAEPGTHTIRLRAKQALRDQMRRVREALPPSACDKRSAEINERLLTVEELAKAATILLFATVRNEVRTRPCMEAAWAAGKRVALPRVVGDELQLQLVEQETVLVEGAFAVPEPPAECARLRPDEVDFAVIPALAVDPRGYRIGYGGGYYDKLIPRLERACTCVIAYDFQLVPEVPEMPFDAPVDVVVTDKRLIRVG